MAEANEQQRGQETTDPRCTVKLSTQENLNSGRLRTLVKPHKEDLENPDPEKDEPDSSHFVEGHTFVYAIDRVTNHRRDSRIIFYCGEYKPFNLPLQIQVVQFANIIGGDGTFLGVPKRNKDCANYPENLKKADDLLEVFLRNSRERSFMNIEDNDGRGPLLWAIRERQRRLIAACMKEAVPRQVAA